MSDSAMDIGEPHATTIERRRPGRREFTNPYLIALLRHAGEIGRAPPPAGLTLHGEAVGDRFELSPDDARLGHTISLIDGACQLGWPCRPAAHCEVAPEEIADRFLDNQVHYVAGVSLATMRGPVPVQELRMSDVVLTHSGKRLVTWIGGSNAEPAPGAASERTNPVLIQQGALGSDLPDRDLRAAPGHCLWIAGRIIPVRLLVNNRNIWQLPVDRAVSYVHVLYDKPALGQLITTPHQATPFWRRIVARADAGPQVQLLADGRMINAVGRQTDRRVFIIPPRTQTIQLVASEAVMVSYIELQVNGDYQMIAADHPGLQAGWNVVERRGSALWRTMQSVAEVPLKPRDVPAQLTLHLRRAGTH